MSPKTSEYYERRIANSTWRQYNDTQKQSRVILSMYRKAAAKISAEIFEIEKTLCQDGFLDEKRLNRYGRLKKIKTSFGDVLGDLEQSTRKQFLKSLTQGMKNNYENIVGELGIDLNLPNLGVFEAMAKEPWRGEDFSARLWRNKELLLKNLEDTLVAGIAQGQSITEMALKLDDLMSGGFKNVHRLVRTETMHYLNAASLQGYKDSGVEYIQFWAAADERTCSRCGLEGMHTSIYPVGKAPILPIHANCRCCYLPVTDKEVIAEYLTDQKKGKPEAMSLILTGKDDPFGKNAEKIKPTEGFYDVAIHGNNKGELGVVEVVDGENHFIYFTPEDICDRIKKSDDYKKEGIRLISCDVGADTSDTPQKIANILGVEVMAPDQTIYVYSDGKMEIGKKNDGQWITFKPEVEK